MGGGSVPAAPGSNDSAPLYYLYCRVLYKLQKFLSLFQSFVYIWEHLFDATEVSNIKECKFCRARYTHCRK